MPTPLHMMLPQIVTLNVDTEPYSYYAQGTQITGWWDIVKATSLYPTQVVHADKSYRLIVDLNESRNTFDYRDYTTETDGHIGFTDDGDGFSIGGERRWSSGKMIKKEWSFEWGGASRSSTGGDDPQVGVQPVTYSFQTSRIKEPLFAWLESHGWQHATGLGRILGH